MNPINKYCKVKNCRFYNSHVTNNHMCGNCNKYGHGEIECNNIALQLNLTKYNLEQLPENLYCKFAGCSTNKYHTTDAHHCEKCNKRYHSKSTCLLDKVSCLKITCPLCKQENQILTTQNKIFG